MNGQALPVPVDGRAFTLVEVLVVIGLVGLLSALLLPALAQAKRKAQRTQCLSNFRQLQTAWLLYNADHGALPPNNDQPDAGKHPARPSWVAGWLRLDSQPGDKTDSTNTALLVGAEYAPLGSIGPYVQVPALYKCALDHSTVRIDGQELPRARTVSMNAYLNGSGVWQDTNHLTFKHLEEMPDPARIWVLIEEREDSINDGYFALMVEARYAIIDTPGNYHENGAVISFADGHVEYRKWVEPTTLPPLQPGVHLAGVPIYTSGQDQDLKWLIERATVRKSDGSAP